MSLILQSCAVVDGKVVANYLASAGAGNEAPIRLESSDRGAVAQLLPLDDWAMADTEEAAFDALADHLEAMAKALRARGEAKLGIPVYG